MGILRIAEPMAKPILTTVDERGIVQETADVPGFRILVGANAQVSVGTFAELSQIKDSKMETGAIAYVGSRKGVFVLDKSSPLSAMTSSVANTRSGVGKWVRSIAPNSHWASQDLWFLDPVSGSDDNSGAASGSAIKTLEELTWRLSFLYQGLPYLINLLNDVSGADKMCWNPIMLPRREGSTTLGSGQRASVVFQGMQTTVRTGTFTGASTSTTVSAQATITDSNAGDWNLERDKLFHVTSGASSGTTGWIDENLGAGVCRVSSPLNSAASGLAGGGFTGDYKVVELTKWNCDFVINAPFQSVIVRFKDIDFRSAANSLLALYSTAICFFTRCKFVSTSGVPSILCTQGQFVSCVFSSLAGTPTTPTTLQMFKAAHLRVVYTLGCVMRSITLEPFDSLIEINSDLLMVGGSRIRNCSSGAPSSGGKVLIMGFMHFFNWAGLSTADAAIVVRGEGSSVILANGTNCGVNGQCTASITYGLRVENGGKFLIHPTTTTPSLSGSLGEIIFEGGTKMIPVLTGSAAVPAEAICNSWAQWAAAPFNSNLVSYTTFGVIRRQLVS